MKKSISRTQFIFFSILGICMTFQICNAQRPIVVNNCPTPNSGERAYFYVKSFLTFNDSQDARLETGANNESVEQIRPVSDQAICSELNQIVQGNPKYKSIDDNLDSKSTKYYYRTNNIFYIFWTRKPEYDTIPNTGPQKLFIVISLDYQHVWEYYF